MARTILEIAHEAVDRDNTAPRPATLFGTNDRNARVIVAAAKDTMREIMRSTDYRGLSELTSTWVLALKPGVFAYPLPPDFLRTIVNTEHRNGWPLGLIGPVSPQTWSYWIAGGSAVAAPMAWRIQNNAIFFNPTPQTAELVSIEYISRYPVVSDIMEGDYDVETPPNAIAPMVPRDGHLEGDVSAIAYAQTDQEFAYEAGPGYDAATWSVELSEVLRRINPMSQVFPKPQVRRPEFSADTDMPAFDDDYLLSLGITWRTRYALGKDYAEQAAAFEAELSMKLGSDAGGAQNIRLGANRQTCDVLPLGGSTWLVS